MRIHLIIAIVVLMAGCGDQVWCGSDGCEGKESHDVRSLKKS